MQLRQLFISMLLFLLFSGYNLLIKCCWHIVYYTVQSYERIASLSFSLFPVFWCTIVHDARGWFKSPRSMIHPHETHFTSDCWWHVPLLPFQNVELDMSIRCAVVRWKMSITADFVTMKTYYATCDSVG
jgi:hypothetical protein